MSLLGMKRFEGAFSAFDAAVNANPAQGAYLLMRARMHRQFGRTDEAVTDLESAFVRDPDETIGWTLQALQRAGYWTSKQAPRAMTPATAIKPVRVPCLRLVPTISATLGPGVAINNAVAWTKTR
jgi:predicted Zn-dependent protease